MAQKSGRSVRWLGLMAWFDGLVRWLTLPNRYPEEKEKGFYVTTMLNMQALGSLVTGIIPVIINR